MIPNLGLATVALPVAGVLADVLPGEGGQTEGGVALVRIEIPRAMADGQDSLKAIREG